MNSTLDKCIKSNETTLKETNILRITSCDKYEEINSLKGIDDINYINVVDLESNNNIIVKDVNRVKVIGQNNFEYGPYILFVFVLLLIFLGYKILNGHKKINEDIKRG